MRESGIEEEPAEGDCPAGQASPKRGEHRGQVRRMRSRSGRRHRMASAAKRGRREVGMVRIQGPGIADGLARSVRRGRVALRWRRGPPSCRLGSPWCGIHAPRPRMTGRRTSPRNSGWPARFRSATRSYEGQACPGSIATSRRARPHERADHGGVDAVRIEFHPEAAGLDLPLRNLGRSGWTQGSPPVTQTPSRRVRCASIRRRTSVSAISTVPSVGMSPGLWQ